MERTGKEGDDRSLGDLLAAFELCAPAERIGFRDPVLAFGAACVSPLSELAGRRTDLAGSVAAWLEVLVQRQPDTRPAAMKVLAVIAKGGDGSIARGALARMGGTERVAGTKAGRKGPAGPSAVEAAVHARIIQAAREGRTLTYGQLETNRRYVGRYLFNISRAEADQGHPPLAALVVKTNGLPGDGFLPAMIEVGFAHRGEALEVVWTRAVAEVFAFWAPAGAGAAAGG